MKFNNNRLLFVSLFLIFLCFISAVSAENETINEIDNEEYSLNQNHDIEPLVYPVFSTHIDNQESGILSSTEERTTTILKPLTINVKQGTKFAVKLFYLSGTLQVFNEHPISNVTVKIIANGQDYYRTTNSNGTAYLNMNLGVGSHNISYSYIGNSQFQPISNFITIHVYTGNCYLNYYSSEIDRGSNFEVVAFNDNNVKLTNKRIKFEINGGEYYRTTDSNGRAALTINLNSNNYIMKCKINDGSYVSDMHEVELIVHDLKNVIIAPINLQVKKGDKLYVRFFDETYNPIVGHTVTFTINGNEYNRTTNNKGQVGMAINLNEGEYPVKIKYDPNYNKNSQGHPVYKYSYLDTIIKSVIVSSSNVYSFSSYNSVVNYGSNFNFVLKDQNGNYMSGKQVWLSIGGEKYSRTTNSYGSASKDIWLNRGLHYVGLSYANNNGIGMLYTLIYVNDNYVMNNAQSNVDISLYTNIVTDYNCVNNPDLINMATSIVANCDSDLEKINALHNYVYKFGYRYYGSGIFTASEALSMHRGNCYDQTNVEMSMAKILNLPVRGMTGISAYNNNVGHAWLQVYIDGLWIVTNPTYTMLFGDFGQDTYSINQTQSYTFNNYGIQVTPNTYI